MTSQPVFTRRVPAYFDEPYLPSPRHRVRRIRQVTTTFPVHIPVVAQDDAPVALQTINAAETSLGLCIDTTDPVDYRYWNGAYWAKPRMRAFHARGSQEYATLESIAGRVTVQRRPIMSRRQARAAYQRAYRNFIMVNNELYQRILEPEFVVMTFGLSHNHGGTALMVRPKGISQVNPNCIFHCMDEVRARARAEEVALGRGDTDSVPIVAHGQIVVLRPDLITRRGH